MSLLLFFDYSMGKMNPSDQELAYQEVTTLLNGRRLAEALSLLHQQSQGLGFSDIAAQAEQLQSDYARLLQYTTTGTTDPTRKAQLESLYSKAWDALDLFKLSQHLTDAQLSDPITCKMIEDFRSLRLLDAERDEQMGALFLRIKSSFPLSREVRHELHEMMLDEQLPTFERATMLSAIMLNLLQHFDAQMLELVYAYTLDDQPIQIRIQAMITLVLCGMRFDTRIAYDFRLRELYKLIVETEGDLLTAIQATLFFCEKKPNLAERLTNVIKVELGKLRSGKSHMSIGELMNFFQDGTDYGYPSFFAFSRHSFFSDPKNEHHWLMPYSSEQAKVKELASSHPDAPLFLKMMSGSLAQCNTSKYSHLLMVEKQFPSVLDQLKNQIQNLPIPVEDIAELDEYTIQRNYLHDLFRYFRISLEGKKIHQGISLKHDFFTCRCLRECVLDPDRLEKLCHTFYESRQWGYASLCLSRLTRQRVTPKLLEMLIDAAEKDGNTEWVQEGIRRYMALYSSDESLYLRLAKLYANDQLYVNEETLLHEALKLYPQSNELKLQMAICLNQQKRPTEAIPILQHIADEGDFKHPTFTQLALAYLLLGQYDEAEEEYLKAAAISTDDELQLSIGTVISLLRGDIVQAGKRFKLLLNITVDYDGIRVITDNDLVVDALGSDVSLLTLLHDMNVNAPDSPPHD